MRAAVRLRSLLVTGGLVVALGLSACSAAVEVSAEGEGGPTPSGGTPLPSEVITVFARFTRGGYIPYELAGRQAPQLVILSDGTVFRAGQLDASPDAPALPSQEATKLTEAEVRSILDLIGARASLFAGVDFGAADITDHGMTEVSVWLDGTERSVDVYALYADEAGGLSGAQQEAQDELRELIDDVEARLSGTERRWVASAPLALEVKARPAQDPNPGIVMPLVFPADISLLAPGDATSCALAEGASLVSILTAARDTAVSTTWLVGGQEVQLFLRPLYPHQSGCTGGGP